MPVKRWMPARERRGDADERRPAVVQLAAADQHRADLRQLAALAREAVRLRVDGEELGGRERLLEEVRGGQQHWHRTAGHTPAAGRHAAALAADRVRRTMRIRCAVAVAGLLALAGCGDDGDHANKDRPPPTINVTAAIAGREIHVSPRRFGGGPIRPDRLQPDRPRAGADAGDGRPRVRRHRHDGRRSAPPGRARCRWTWPRARTRSARPTGGSGPRCSASARQRPSAQNELLLP